MSHMIRIGVCVLLLTASVGAAPPVTASPENMQAAKSRFRQGKAIHVLGAYDQALAEFEAAFALVPLPELIFNIARAQQKKNEIDRALETYRRYLELDPEGRVADEARRQVAILTVEKERAKPAPVLKVEPVVVPAVSVIVLPTPPPRKSHRTAIIAGVSVGVIVLVGVGVGLGVGLSQPTKSAFDSAVVFPPVKGQ